MVDLDVPLQFSPVTVAFNCSIKIWIKTPEYFEEGFWKINFFGYLPQSLENSNFLTSDFVNDSPQFPYSWLPETTCLISLRTVSVQNSTNVEEELCEKSTLPTIASLLMLLKLQKSWDSWFFTMIEHFFERKQIDSLH